jgi:hypothetical protein
MKEFAQQLRLIIASVESQLSQMNDEQTSKKPAPDSWSKKEMLGHLIDSAANNHQRFVRAGYNAAAQFPSYDQNKWVRVQKYNDRPWDSLLALWSTYNTHLAHVIECLPEEARFALCNIGKKEPVTLEFLVIDYIRHLRHHLEIITDKQL